MARYLSDEWIENAVNEKAEVMLKHTAITDGTSVEDFNKFVEERLENVRERYPDDKDLYTKISINCSEDKHEQDNYYIALVIYTFRHLTEKQKRLKRNQLRDIRKWNEERDRKTFENLKKKYGW